MKMKKIVALVTASALCLGMSMTVFADNSIIPDELTPSKPVYEYEENGDAYTINIGTPNDRTTGIKTYNIESSKNDLTKKYIEEYKKANPDKLSDDALKALSDDDIASKDWVKNRANDEYKKVAETLTDDPAGRKAMTEIMKTNGFAVNGEKPVIIYEGNLKPVDQDGNVITDLAGESVTQDFYISDADVEVNDTIYILHYKEDGTWEVIPQIVLDGGAGRKYVRATFDSLSPVAFVKMMSNGDVVKVDRNGVPEKDENGNIQVVNKGNTTTKASTASTQKSSVATGRSPKTGEF